MASTTLQSLCEKRREKREGGGRRADRGERGKKKEDRRQKGEERRREKREERREKREERSGRGGTKQTRVPVPSQVGNTFGGLVQAHSAIV